MTASSSSAPRPPHVPARASRLLPRQDHRPARHHRHLQHGPRAGAGRHALLPVRLARRRPSPTCCACPRAWPTRTPWPASTSAAARPSSSATRRPTRRPSCCAPTAASSSRLGGRYVTACDVGTYVADMDVVSETTRFATGRSEANGGAGDSSVLTAYGVFQGQRACRPAPVGRAHPQGPHRRHRRRRQGRAHPGRPPARGRRQGRRDRRQRAGPGRTHRRSTPQIEVVPDTDDARALRHRRLRALRARRRARRHHRRGPARHRRLRRRQQPARRRGRGRHRRPAPRARHHLRPRLPGQRRRRHPGQRRAARVRLRARQEGRHARSSTTPSRCCETADARGITPAAAADHIAEERMAAAQPGGIWLPAR